MEKKIFNEYGFLSKEGHAFVNDGFTKEVKRVLSTATSESDVLVIASILKSIIGIHALELGAELTKKPTDRSSNSTESYQVDKRLIRPEQSKNKTLPIILQK